MKICPRGRDSLEFLDATWLSDFPARLVHPSILPLYSTPPPTLSILPPSPIPYSCLTLHLATPLYYSYRRCKIQTAAQPGYCIRSSILRQLYISLCKCVYTLTSMGNVSWIRVTVWIWKKGKCSITVGVGVTR